MSYHPAYVPRSPFSTEIFFNNKRRGRIDTVPKTGTRSGMNQSGRKLPVENKSIFSCNATEILWEGFNKVRHFLMTAMTHFHFMLMSLLFTLLDNLRQNNTK
jgi:hypothetical protein